MCISLNDVEVELRRSNTDYTSSNKPHIKGLPKTVPHTVRLRRIERLSWWMDQSIKGPGNFRIGLDGLIGLIPGIGDGLSLLVSLYIIGEARAAGARRLLVMKMIWRVSVDAVLGTIPLVGDIFDIVNKANTKNLQDLLKHLEKQNR